MAQPIWKDYYVDLGNRESATYGIFLVTEDNEQLLYQGIAHRRPDEKNLMVKVNDICANVLSIYLTTKNLGFNVVEQGEFIISLWEDGRWSIKESVQFYADYSYDNLFSIYNKGLSDPINCRVSPHTPIPFSQVASEHVEVRGAMIGNYNPPIEGMGGYYMIDISSLKDGDEVSLYEVGLEQSISYNVVDCNARYALYYVNAYGGVDMLLIEGNHSERDALTRHTMQTEYDNRASSNRGKVNIANEITKSLTLHTSWLTDDESMRMHHLLNSTQVLLYDLQTKEEIPVILTNTTTEYKTFKGGGKLVNYAIELSLANDRIRR